MDQDTHAPLRSKNAGPSPTSAFEHETSMGTIAMVVFSLVLIVGIFLGAV
jgi:hypothetical protein